jgi:holo-[acyl-carrier-protein] synthase
VKGAVVLVPVARVEGLVRAYGDRFLRRVFSPQERGACCGRRDEAERLAARLAAKQAARRCFAHPPRLTAIRVETDAAGAPHLEIDPAPGARVFVSLSHDGGVAGAAVLMERDDADSGHCKRRI